MTGGKLVGAIVGIAVVIFGIMGLTSCAASTPSDQVGLWYEQGPLDGNKFLKCKDPGSGQDFNWNDQIYNLPTNVRTWNIASDGSGDTDQGLVVMGKPAEGQQSGVEVLVYPQTNLKLNTYCGPNNDNANSPLVQWWNNLGDRYDADTEAGWLNMLKNTVIPALEKGKNALRVYTADELVLGSVWAEAEKAFATSFMTELTRLSGGTYFCGPDFSRTDPGGKLWASEAPCSPVQVSIKDVDYRDPGIQEARNGKQKALETAAANLAKAQGDAAAKIAEAQGQVEAAAKLATLYANPAWVALEQAKLETEQVKACSTGANCRIVIDKSGRANLLLNE